MNRTDLARGCKDQTSAPATKSTGAVQLWQSPRLLLLTRSGQRPSLPKTFHMPLALPSFSFFFLIFDISSIANRFTFTGLAEAQLFLSYMNSLYLWSHRQSQGSSLFEVTMVTAELELWVALLLLLITLDIYQKEQFLFLIKSKDFALRSIMYKYNKVMHFKYWLCKTIYKCVFN